MTRSWQHSLLSDELVTVRSAGRKNRRQVTLPDVLAQLGTGDIADFPRVTPHQQQPLHSFLVQLAAMALHRAGERDPVRPAGSWKELLLTLTDGDEGAFALVVHDLSKPAFLQPPVPKGKLEKWKQTETPDSLDVLVTAKDHDVKSARARNGDPELWLWALLSLQTMQGFLGAGNYGISRMNGGFASRPQVGFGPSLRPGPRFVRDVRVLLEWRADVVKLYDYANTGGHALLWLLPWDGSDSLELSACDPYFVEICRRVRFTNAEGELHCFSTSTQCARVNAKARNGVVGDPWIPVEAGADKALTVPGDGFTYARTRELLFGSKLVEPLTQRIRVDDPEELSFVARVLVRGQGKTEGLHERVLPVRGKVRTWLARSNKESLGELSEAWVSLAGIMRNKVLRPALCALVQGAPDKLNLKDDRIDADLDTYEAAVNQCFFPRLFEAIDRAGDDLAPLAEPNQAWGGELMRIGTTILEGAIERLPVPEARRYRAIAAAERLFFGGARNRGFPSSRARSSASISTKEANHDAT